VLVDEPRGGSFITLVQPGGDGVFGGGDHSLQGVVTLMRMKTCCPVAVGTR
jgi:hypothetical protein